MEIVYLFLFASGLGIGSFISCWVYRINTFGHFLKGKGKWRSFCDQCGHLLAWYDNLPLFSFFWLQGRCRYCHSPIPWSYPLVELTTSLLFWLAGQNILFQKEAYFPRLIYWLLMITVLEAVLVSDLRYGTVPDQIVYPGLVFSLFWTGYHTLIRQEHSLVYLFSGLGAGIFFLFLFFLTRGRGMGEGDIKLAVLMGLFLGWPQIAVALYLAFLTGALVGVILVLLGRKKIKQSLPFGPFLVMGTLIALFWGEGLWRWFWGIR